jgi:O-antigen/teichoic acid export membrane protein
VLYRHSLVYLWARGVPSVLGFIAIAVYSRLLSPDQLGLYSLVITASLTANAVLFQWLRQSLLRFLPDAAEPGTFLATSRAAFVVVALVVFLAGGITAAFLLEGDARLAVAFGTAILPMLAWLELNLDVLRSRLQPKLFALVSVLRAVVAVVAGTLLVLAGWGPWGLLVAFALSLLLPAAIAYRWVWPDVRGHRVDPTVTSQMMRYGLPLTLSLAFSFILRGSDRLMLGVLEGVDAVGLYGVSYDLAQSSLDALMTIVNAAAFPLAVNALRAGGVEAASAQLGKNLSLLAAVSVPAATGLILVSTNLSTVLLGSAYVSAASLLIPWIAIGVLLAGLRGYYVDHAFQLGQRPGLLVRTLGYAAVANVLLNLWWIPAYGFVGAAAATVCAYLLALVLGLAYARRSFPLPLMTPDLPRIAVATAVMAAVLVPWMQQSGTLWLLAQVVSGAVVYLGVLFMLNGLGLRGWLASRT